MEVFETGKALILAELKLADTGEGRLICHYSERKVVLKESLCVPVSTRRLAEGVCVVRGHGPTTNITSHQTPVF